MIVLRPFQLEVIEKVEQEIATGQRRSSSSRRPALARPL